MNKMAELIHFVVSFCVVIKFVDSCERIVNIWNRLPVDSTDFGSLHSFRNSLDAIDVTILVDAW